MPFSNPNLQEARVFESSITKGEIFVVLGGQRSPLGGFTGLGRHHSVEEEARLETTSPNAEFAPDTLATSSGNLSLRQVTLEDRQLDVTGADGAELTAEIQIDFQLAPDKNIIRALVERGILPNLGRLFHQRVRSVIAAEVGRNGGAHAIRHQNRLEHTILNTLRSSCEGMPGSHGHDEKSGHLGIIIGRASLLLSHRGGSPTDAAVSRELPDSSGPSLAMEYRQLSGAVLESDPGALTNGTLARLPGLYLWFRAMTSMSENQSAVIALPMGMAPETSFDPSQLYLNKLDEARRAPNEPRPMQKPGQRLRPPTRPLNPPQPPDKPSTGLLPPPSE